MNLYSKTIVRVLSLTAVLLVIAGLVTKWLRYSAGMDTLFGLVPLFDLGQEGNLPAYFSSMLLLLSAVLLAVIASAERRRGSAFARLWMVLCIGFAYLSVDEAAHIHELMARPAQAVVGAQATAGYFHFAWVIPGILGAAVLAVIYVKFLLALPRKYMATFLLAGTLYLGGAIGVEMLNGRHAAAFGMDNFRYNALVAVEESMEMTGIILFINALLSYIEVNFGSTVLYFAHESEEKRGLARPELGGRIFQAVLPFKQRKGGLE